MLRKRLVLHCMQVSSFTGMRKTTHIINADMCQFLASLNESRESYESYFTPKEMFDIWKKQKVSDSSPFPVTRKTYQELDTVTRLKLRNEYLEKQFQEKKSDSKKN